MEATEIHSRLKKIIAEKSDDTAWTISTKHLKYLINEVLEDERERLAQFCEAEDVEGEPKDWRSCAFYLANCIRSFDWDEYVETDSSLPSTSV
jgi:hypothetical protein